MVDMDIATKERICAALEQYRLVFLGGAGVSVASGIPDFRSPGGLYSRKREDGRSYEELLSHEYFMEDPKGFYEFYWANMVAPSAKPNKAHLALADYERRHPDMAILTQNIDGLHQLAGSERVYEIHGTTYHYHCMNCSRHYELTELRHEGVPQCPRCGGLIKPDVVLYGEGLPEDAVYGGIEAVERAGVMIVGGTSLRVYPFAAFPQYFHGSLSVLINREATPIDGSFDIVLHEDIGDALEELLHE